MPAINLAQLKTKAVLLSEKFSEPDSFIHDLNELLDFYTNRTIRSTQIVQRLSLPTYHTPAPVLRQIQAEMVTLAQTYPLEAIALSNALWKAGFLESRLLAASLIGNTPPAQAIPALAHLPEWMAQSTDKVIRTALVNDAFARLRRENPEALFILLEDWLKSPHKSLQTLGLQALIPVLTDPQFENLPAVFRILKPVFSFAGPAIQMELKDCLSALATVSPIETLAFLREMMSNNPAPLLLRTLRRIQAGFPPELQSGLREMLRDL
jgi:hypothetical protein